MKRIHEPMEKGDAADARIAKITSGTDWCEWHGPGTRGLMLLLDACTETLIWIDFDPNDVKDTAVLKTLLRADKICLEEQGKDAEITPNPLKRIITVAVAKESPEITNEMRTWYIMFVLWCQENDLDHHEHDFNELKGIDDAVYYDLQRRAFFKILASDKCPVCWGHVGPEKRRSLPVVCDCGIAFDVDVKKLQAWRHDD